MIEERAGLAEDRIERRQCHARDVFVCARTFTGFAVVHKMTQNLQIITDKSVLIYFICVICGQMPTNDC